MWIRTLIQRRRNAGGGLMALINEGVCDCAVSVCKQRSSVIGLALAAGSTIEVTPTVGHRCCIIDSASSCARSQSLHCNVLVKAYDIEIDE
jgi:hypothetical protein